MISTFCRADRLRLANLFRSTEETRYYLNGIFIDPLPDGGVRLSATDGHRLCMFRDDAGFTSAPCIAMLPKSALDAVKRCKHRDFVWFGVVGEHDGKGRHEARIFNAFEAPVSELADIREAMEDITNPHVVWAGAVEMIDGEFPDIEYVVPARRAETSVGAAFNQKLMAAFGEVAGDLGGASVCRIYPSGKDPAIIDCGRADFLGVLMPIGHDSKLLSDVGMGVVAPPLWAKRPAPLSEVAKSA